MDMQLQIAQDYYLLTDMPMRNEGYKNNFLN